MEKKHTTLSFALYVSTAALAFIGLVVYVICSAVMTYYSDCSAVIITASVCAVAIIVALAVLSKKGTAPTWITVLLIPVSCLLVFAMVSIIGDRIDSFAWLVMSDLERMNIDGYRALYTSIGAVCCYVLALIVNSVNAFK